MVLGCDKHGIRAKVVKVIFGIERYHQVKTSRVLTIGLNQDTSMGKRIYEDKVSFFSNLMSCNRLNIIVTFFLWFSLCFKEYEYEDDIGSES